MLNKKELLRLASPKNAKAEEYFDAMESLDVVIVFSKKTVAHMRMLLADIFCRNGQLYRVFIHKTCKSKSGYEHTTYNYGTKRWLSSVLLNLRKTEDVGYSWLLYNSSIAYIGRDVACDYFGFKSQKNLLENISHRQYQQVEMRAAQRLKELNRFMKGMPEPNKRQMNWMKSLYYNQMVGFFKGKTVFCENCRKTTVTEHKLKANDTMICPYCKTELHLRSNKYCGGRDGLRNEAFIITKHKGKAVLRHFKVFKFFDEEHNANVGYYEFGRDIIEDKRILKYERDYYGSSWRKGRHNDYDSYMHTSPYKAGYLYRGNFKNAVKDTPIQYSGLEFTDIHEEIKWDMVLQAYYRFPMLESLIKVAGFNKLAINIIEAVDSKIRHYRYNHNVELLNALNPEATTLSGFLGIGRGFLSMVVKENFSLEKLSKFNQILKSGVRFNSEDLMLLSGDIDVNDFVKVCKKTKLSLHKTFRYIEQQKTTINFYIRYIKECEKLGLDVTSSRVNLTRDINSMFKSIYESNNDKNDKQLNLRYQKIYNNALCALNTKISNLNFTVPYSFTDFVIQGSSLEQCICRNNIYFHNVVDQISIMVFISDDNNSLESRFTCEIKYSSNGKFYSATCLGFDNHRYPNEEQKEIISQYIEYVNATLDKKNGKFILRKQPQLASA